jgi:hypothetical protein
MNTWLLIAFVAFSLTAVYVAARALTVYLHWRGQRLVTCPETREYAVVEIDAAQAARQSLAGKSHLELRDCSRWDERGPCAEPCLNQIVEATDGCLVRSYVERFYEGKACAICRKPIGPIDWTRHMPAAIDQEGRTITWDMVPAKLLPRFLNTHLPVCWDCHIATSFRREHSALVTDRPMH